MDSLMEFFILEMQEQSNDEDGSIDWDDYSQGSADIESYDP